ncbi:MAG: Mobile element protein [Frankiales bacterium]|nr:Mobile element protein [Frankiales bacterium]
MLAYWTPTGRRGVSNGPTEATNAPIKKVKRAGHGFRNFDSYRLRLLPSVGLDWRIITGRLRLPPRSEDTHHARWRRATLLVRP